MDAGSAPRSSAANAIVVGRRSTLQQLLRGCTLPSWIRGCLLAIGTTLLAFLLRLLVDPWLGDQMPYITFILAVAITGLYGGTRPALLATLLGAGTAYFCFVPPRYQWGFAESSDAIGFAVYLLVAVGVILLTRARNRAAEQAERSLKQQIDTEQKLLDAEALFKQFMDNSPACAYLRDATGKHVYLNEAAKREFGLRNEGHGLTNKAWLSLEVSRRLCEQDEQVLRAGRALTFMDKVANAEGQKYWLTTKFPFTDQTGSTFVGGICFDMTDRVQAEMFLHKSERLIASAHMASMLAHEINNPLAALTNLLFLLQREPLTANGSEYVEKAASVLARINRIASMTFGFYHEKDTPTLLDICAVIKQATEVLAATESFALVHIENSFQCSANVIASLPRIRQLFTNLLTNAMEAGAHRIQVRVKPGRNCHRPGQTGVCITISDDGRGISRDQQKRICEPFFTTKANPGAGLGLWASRAIVMKNEGIIQLRSSVSGRFRGTCLRIFLPAQVEPRSEDAHDAKRVRNPDSPASDVFRREAITSAILDGSTRASDF